MIVHYQMTFNDAVGFTSFSPLSCTFVAYFLLLSFVAFMFIIMSHKMRAKYNISSLDT